MWRVLNYCCCVEPNPRCRYNVFEHKNQAKVTEETRAGSQICQRTTNRPCALYEFRANMLQLGLRSSFLPEQLGKTLLISITYGSTRACHVRWISNTWP